MTEVEAVLPAAEVAALMTLAEAAAREAGALIATRGAARPEVSATKSSPTDVVTEMDRASEALLRRTLHAARPGDGILGEEAGLQTGSSGVTWVIDPIDGTVNYLYGIPAYAVSVAAVIGDPTVPGSWQPVAACVHNPATGHTWTAGLGRGARLDGQPLAVPVPPPLGGALIGTGFGYRAGRRRGQARVVAALLPKVRDVRRLGSASIDLCMVASGWLDGYYERGLNVWDMAAATLVATEAGAQVHGLSGRPPSEEMVVAGRPPLVGTLVAELEALGADREDPSPDGPGADVTGT